MDRTLARAKELIEQYHFEGNCLWLLENLLLDTPLIDVEMSNRDKPLTKLGWHTAHKFSVRDDVPVVDRTHTTDIWCLESEYGFFREYRGPHKARDYESPRSHDALAIVLEVNGELVLDFDLFQFNKVTKWGNKSGFYPHDDPECRIIDWERLEKLKLGRWIEDLDTIILDQKRAYSEKAIQNALAKQSLLRKSEEEKKKAEEQKKKAEEQKKKAEEEKRERELAKKIDLGEYE
jgi:hypothetical protein